MPRSILRLAATLLPLVATATAAAQCDQRDDDLEQNDTCETAAWTLEGADGLWVARDDADWYRIPVLPQGSVVVTITFVHATANLDMRLWSDCDGAVVWESTGTLDSETVLAFNTTDRTVEYVCEVYVADSSEGACNTYDMALAGDIGTNLGTNYCAATPNSTGEPSTMSATGSNSVALNDFTLHADNVPRRAWGLFYYGAEQTEFPFGDGYRCVASGGIGNFVLRPLVRAGGASYALERRVDLSSPPRPEGRILGWSTWYFQAWFRDVAGGGSLTNLSDGLAVNFVP